MEWGKLLIKNGMVQLSIQNGMVQNRMRQIGMGKITEFKAFLNKFVV